MPKIVDHDARRRELATALWRVVREEGAHAISVRSVAREAGWSAGALRHYFGSQDDLFGFALELLADQVRQRVQAHLRDPALTPLARGVAVVEEFLPLDEDRLGEVLLWVAFTDRARHEPGIRHLRELSWEAMRHLCRLVSCDLAGRPWPSYDDRPLRDAPLERRAVRLQVLVDGWCLQGVSYPERVDAAYLHDQVLAELSTWPEDARR